MLIDHPILYNICVLTDLTGLFLFFKCHSRVPQMLMQDINLWVAPTFLDYLETTFYLPPGFQTAVCWYLEKYIVVKRNSWAEAKSFSLSVLELLQPLLLKTSGSCRHVNTANSNNSHSSNSLQSEQLSSFGKRAQLEETEKLNERRSAEALAVLLTCGGKGCSLVMLSSGYVTSPMGR